MGVKIAFSEQFLEDAGKIYSARIAQELKDAIALFEIVPTIGSKIARKSLTEEFGEDIFKWVIGPFDLIYTFDETTRVVQLHALIPQRKVR